MSTTSVGDHRRLMEELRRTYMDGVSDPDAVYHATHLVVSLPEAMLENCHVAAPAYDTCVCLEWSKVKHGRFLSMEVMTNGNVDYRQWPVDRNSCHQGSFQAVDVEQAKHVVQWFFEDAQ